MKIKGDYEGFLFRLGTVEERKKERKEERMKSLSQRERVGEVRERKRKGGFWFWFLGFFFKIIIIMRDRKSVV